MEPLPLRTNARLPSPPLTFYYTDATPDKAKWAAVKSGLVWRFLEGRQSPSQTGCCIPGNSGGAAGEEHPGEGRGEGTCRTTRWSRQQMFDLSLDYLARGRTRRRCEGEHTDISTVQTQLATPDLSDVRTALAGASRRCLFSVGLRFMEGAPPPLASQRARACLHINTRYELRAAARVFSQKFTFCSVECNNIPAA